MDAHTAIPACINNWAGVKLCIHLTSGLKVYGSVDEVVVPNAVTALVNRGSGNEVVVVLASIVAIEPI